MVDISGLLKYLSYISGGFDKRTIQIDLSAKKLSLNLGFRQE